jgi:hypothetical protein
VSYNVLDLTIPKLGEITMFRLKTICSFKPMQMCPNNGMDLIHDNYAKPQPIDLFDWIVVSSIISMS